MVPTPEEPRVCIQTYGCQMNVLDSELVENRLWSLGYRLVSTSDDADVVLLNTCSVRDLSEHKVWSELGRLGAIKRHQRPDLVVGVLGCMAEREHKGIQRRMPHVDLVCGPSKLDTLPLLLDNALHNRGAQLAVSGHAGRKGSGGGTVSDSLEALDLSRANSSRFESSQAYVRITRGCNKFCSYCVVPYTRGPEVHRPPAHIIEEVKRLSANGVVEVTLLGQTVNHYEHRDGGRTTTFADLLTQVHDEVTDLPRLRFLTSYPRDFTDDALDVMAGSDRICPYLHIPAQSGSNRMLQLMNRGYTVEAYLELVERARARMPDIRVAGDMIVGFPGETDADHEASLQLLRQVRYKGCFVFKYSPRSGTVAMRRFTEADQVAEEVKKARNLELLELQSEIAQAHHDRLLGQTLDVLVEGHNKLKWKPRVAPEVQLGWQKPVPVPVPVPVTVTVNDTVRLVGRTVGDEIVAFDGPAKWVGKVVQVRAVSATPLTIMAQPVEATQEATQATAPPRAGT